MGEFILKDMVRKAGREAEFEIASAAVTQEALGCRVYGPARRELASHGIGCEGKTARQITRADYGYYDRIYYMDDSNARYLQRMFPGHSDKIRPLLDREVADPWYTGDFRRTWEDLCEGCRAILEEFA